MSQLGCEDVKCSMREPSFGPSAADGPAAVTDSARPKLHISRVRDYRDKFILRQLQMEARTENPGFLYLIEGKERAKIVWAETGEGRVPIGYYIHCGPRRGFSKHAHAVVQFPATFSQVFVRREWRRRGVAMRMMQDFIHHWGGDTIWVESPKSETKALLNKLGYYEPNIRYELWQMMEGLSRWMKIEEFVIRAKLVPTSAEELRVWCGDTSVGIEELR